MWENRVRKIVIFVIIVLVIITLYLVFFNIMSYLVMEENTRGKVEAKNIEQLEN